MNDIIQFVPRDFNVSDSRWASVVLPLATIPIMRTFSNRFAPPIDKGLRALLSTACQNNYNAS
jgi:hypothetical protein